MPIRRVRKSCYQWGHHGKIYCGPGARAKAERQGRAAYAHGYLGEGSGDTSFGDIARKRVSQQLAEEQIVETRIVPIRTTPTFTEDWVLFVTRGKNLSGLEAGRVLIDIDPRLDGEPLAGLLWAFENGRPTITHVWVDPDVQHRGVGRLLIDAYKRFVSKRVIMIGPFSTAGRSFAQRSGAEIVEERRSRYVRESFMPRSEFILAGNKALDAISNLDEVPPGYLQGDALRDATYRALEAGAEPPLEYIGAGATGIVFCDPSFAFKVARHRRGHTLEDEAEWLETAASIPEVAPYVAHLERWDPEQRVIVRECVRGDRGTWGGSSKIHALWDQIAPYMLAEGWTMPELKEDSVIFVDRVPKIVDAGMVSRISNRLLGYVEDVLDGRITPDEYEDWSTLAFYVRREFGQKEGLDEKRANLILERLYELGARRD